MALSVTPLRLDSAAPEVEPFRRAVADVILAWAHVENAMTDLLAAVLGHQLHDIASAILFSPTNIETRIDIANNAVRAYLNFHPPLYERFLALWEPMIKALDGYRRTRNKVAHGQIAVVRHDSGKAHFRLMPPLLDFRRWQDVPEGQLPGMSANDIKQAAAKIESLAAPIARLREVILAIEPSSYEAALHKLDALEVAMQNEKGLPG